MTFEQACREAAAEFLQTVVLVDDRATFGGETGAVENTTDEAGPLIEPDEMSTVAVESKTITPLAKKQGEGLDAGVVTRGFAARGLVCAVLKPEAGASLETETLQAAERADIVVLDWEMDDHGQKAMEIIKGLLKSDHERGDRLRLVVIYTGVSPLAPVGTRIATEVPGLSAGAEPLSLQNRTATTKVVVLGKGGAPNAPEEARSVVDAANLPDRLIEEFAKFAGGLLPNATLGSMAHLRSNTHKLLARFNKRMDAPLITHHALLGSPKDAEQFVADLIIQELEAQIPLSAISSKYAGAESIGEYLSTRINSGFVPKVVFETDRRHEASLDLATAKDLIRNGIAVLESNIQEIMLHTGQSKTLIKDSLKGAKLADRLYCLSGETYDNGKAAHEDFAVTSSIRRSWVDIDPAKPDLFPTLKLGSIVHDDQNYYLCLTPVCDSVRKTGERANFVFARLDENHAAFSMVVVDGSARRRLTIDRKDVHFRTIAMKPSVDETVRARLAEDKERLVFDPASPREGEQPGPELRWVAEMKPMQAQRVVAAVTSHLSRIGLDEFEWQRIQSPKWS